MSAQLTEKPSQAKAELRRLTSAAASAGGDHETLCVAVRTIRIHLCAPTAAVRVVALRALHRLCKATPSAWRTAWLEYLDVFLAASLDRKGQTPSAMTERIEALKLFRWLVHRRPADITHAQLSSVIAVAECMEDPLRLLCIEVLRELAVADIGVLARCDCRTAGLGALSDTVSREPPHFPTVASSKQAAAGGAAAGAVSGAASNGLGSGVDTLLRAVVPEIDGEAAAPAHVGLAVAITLGHLVDEGHSRAHVAPAQLQLLLSPLTALTMSAASHTPPPAARLDALRSSSACLVRPWVRPRQPDEPVMSRLAPLGSESPRRAHTEL